MIINWYGHSCFKITNQGGHLVVITDPFDKKVGLNPPRCSADIVTVSHNHYDHNNISVISGMEKEKPFIINGAGEYDIKGVSILGCLSFHDKNKKESNIIYRMEIDGIKICHLGDLGQEKLKDNQIEKIGDVDILMIPVGGKYTIGPKIAVKIVHQIEPSVVIPMHYKIPGLKLDIDDAKDFLKEMGLNGVSEVDKLTLKKKDLLGKELEVIVMKP